MIVLKSIFAGVLAVVIAAMVFAVVIPTVSVLYLSWRLPPEKSVKGIGLSFDPVAALRSPVSWITAVIVFSLGFYLEYRRLMVH